MGVILIAVIVLVVLAAVMVLATALRRNSERAVGDLKGETLRNDRRRARPTSGQSVPVGRMVEQSAEIERVSKEVPASKAEVATVHPARPRDDWRHPSAVPQPVGGHADSV
jgi:cytochrome b6-f complex iron-sulfur subunit